MKQSELNWQRLTRLVMLIHVHQSDMYISITDLEQTLYVLPAYIIITE